MAEINGGKLSDLEQAAQSCHIASVKSRWKQRVRVARFGPTYRSDKNTRRGGRRDRLPRITFGIKRRLLITITRSNFRDINNNKQRHFERFSFLLYTFSLRVKGR